MYLRHVEWNLKKSCFISQVYNAHRPMKQRYHYNVANTRVEQHVEKGNDDGLYISSVACCSELWGLIMDAGTGFTAQVIGPPFPHLHQTPSLDESSKGGGVLLIASSCQSAGKLQASG